MSEVRVRVELASKTDAFFITVDGKNVCSLPSRPNITAIVQMLALVLDAMDVENVVVERGGFNNQEYLENTAPIDPRD